MSKVNINVQEAVVTAINKFSSYKGFGADFFVGAQSCNGTVYLQVTLYDSEARRNCDYIHEGDKVRITGDMKVKPYIKKDGTAGCSLIVERPIVFSKIISGNCDQQSQRFPEESDRISP